MHSASVDAKEAQSFTFPFPKPRAGSSCSNAPRPKQVKGRTYGLGGRFRGAGTAQADPFRRLHKAQGPAGQGEFICTGVGPITAGPARGAATVHTLHVSDRMRLVDANVCLNEALGFIHCPIGCEATQMSSARGRSPANVRGASNL